MVNRVQLGDLGGGEFGLKISRESVEVTTVSDPSDLLFDSREEEYGNALLSGTASLTFTGIESTKNTGTISYGTTLSYIPVVLISRVDSSGIVYRHCASGLWSVGIFPDFALGDIVLAYADDITNSSFTIRADRVISGGAVKGGLPNGTHTFSYAVFALGNSTVTSVGP